MPPLAENLLSLITESRIDRYIQMLPKREVFPFLSDEKYEALSSWFTNQTHAVVDDFKREDRVIWLLRLLLYTKYLSLGSRTEEFKGLADKLLSRLREKSGDPHLTFQTFDMQSLMTRLKHFLALPIPAIQNFVFTWQNPRTVIQDFSAFEKDWQEKRGRFINSGAVGKNVEAILQFPDGWTWFNLKQDGCSAEANAMGHCSTGGNPGDINLSLREPSSFKREDGWKPHLTFIWNETTGLLGEMKGPKNSKPKPELFKYIVPLLRLDMIKGINPDLGGGYNPENNFKFFDLPEDVQEELYKEKPALAPASYLLRKEGLTDNSLEEINKILKEESIMPVTRLSESDVLYHDDTVSVYELDSVKEAIDLLFHKINSSVRDMMNAYLSDSFLEREGHHLAYLNTKLITDFLDKVFDEAPEILEELREDTEQDDVLKYIESESDDLSTALYFLANYAYFVGYTENAKDQFLKAVESWVDGLPIKDQGFTFYLMFHDEDLEEPLFERSCFIGISIKDLCDIIDNRTYLQEVAHQGRNIYSKKNIPLCSSGIENVGAKRFSHNNVTGFKYESAFDFFKKNYRDVLAKGMNALIRGKKIEVWRNEII